jgi:hypothetical protein
MGNKCQSLFSGLELDAIIAKLTSGSLGMPGTLGFRSPVTKF